MPLQLVLMALKCQNMLIMTLPAPNLVENCLTYGKTNFPYNFSTNSRKCPPNSPKCGSTPNFVGPPKAPLR